jgi:hypothetical protein
VFWNLKLLTLLTVLLKAPVTLPTERRQVRVPRYHNRLASVTLPGEPPFARPIIPHGRDVTMRWRLYRDTMLIYLAISIVTSKLGIRVITWRRGRGGGSAPPYGKPTRRDTQQQKTSDSRHCDPPRGSNSGRKGLQYLCGEIEARGLTDHLQ